MVKETSYMFITGSTWVKTVTGEDVIFEELGATTHANKSGTAHFAAEDEDERFDLARELVGFLPLNNMEDPAAAPAHRRPPARGAVLADLVSTTQPAARTSARGYPATTTAGAGGLRHHAESIVIGLARLNGRPVGIVGNQPLHLAGVLDINASVKGARFVRFCDAFNIPIISFVDVPGVRSGTSQEWGGIIRHGAKLLYAYAEATVPKLTVITRKAYGGAYDVMASKPPRADINFAWPTAEIAVMGPQGAVNIIFRKEIEKAADPVARRDELVAEYTERFANPYIAAERGYIGRGSSPR